GEIDRRTFLKRATTAIGSLAAANTLLAACAAFPNEDAPPVVDESQPAVAPGMEAKGDLTVGIVEYPDTDDETLMGYLAYPTSIAAAPAVIVIQEWWGLNDHIKDVTRRFANEGFVVLAPDLYHGQVTTEPDEARKLIMELDNTEAIKEIQQAIAYLQGRENVSSDKVGVVGFCMGGGLALRTALASDAVGAIVSFYGQPLDPAEAGQVKAPILSFIGTEDNTPVEAVETMHAAFEQAGIKNEYHVYEGAQHAFFNDTRESYNEQAATDSWPRTLAWFHENLG
ncbi:MAG: dienelactone hydrolase family protein, partial [Anaerolineae bacterium]|nr:dienelactone hydrolase family protein [Anaerolineae bacterium]